MIATWQMPFDNANRKRIIGNAFQEQGPATLDARQQASYGASLGGRNPHWTTYASEAGEEHETETTEQR